ncbi:GDP-L-fucose synthase family protein [Methylotenera mobilis]|uniref:GDP-L-fucose synthase n=1 Tax=Methylotenera mobilis (strain JLW8 / ATCC BAA-1282 / DSM 17540) TaxID=583345 RepID=C6WVI6_METML|nr:GDP-L-fucose synthase [Methylotenera mobilis]ACT47935.1 NAD-dependent epimerase/dehydratase [Methylotenera mobilis JLW8]
MTEKVLLTGARGMVGKNILEHPSSTKWQFLTPSSTELDLTIYADVEAYIALYQPDFIIHAAGRVGGIQANIAAPVDFLIDNLDMGRNVVMAAQRNGVKRLINLSSSCMYPRNISTPLTEDMILTGELEPTNEGYALAKIATMRLCQYIAKQDASFQYKTLIPCNLYGRHDKFLPQHSHLIPAIIHKTYQAMINNEPQVEIWGDGTARREFMYAGDLASAVIRALEHFDTLPNLMNVGLGQDYTINEYYQAVAAVIGYQGSFTHNLSKPVGMARKLVDVQQQSLWGWSANNSLTDGIKQSYEFYLKEYLQ